MINLLDRNAYQKIVSKVTLEQSNKKILPYGMQTPLQLLGKTDTEVSANGKSVHATFYVVQGNYGSLLSHKTASEVGLIQIVCSMKLMQPTLSKADQLMLHYPDITKGMGKLKNFQVKLHIDQSVHPVIQPHRCIPFHIRKKVEQELQFLEDQGIIEKVHHQGCFPL